MVTWVEMNSGAGGAAPWSDLRPEEEMSGVVSADRRPEGIQEFQ